MRRFSNIMVAVDLSSGDHLVSPELAPPTVEAIDRAIWLAKLNSARITFFSALDVSPAGQKLIEESSAEQSVLVEAQDVMARLVRRAFEDHLPAEMHLTFGKSWLEIIRYAIQHDNDLVVAGTRHLGAAKGVLFGSTGMKLLRKCPCPVWITQPRREPNTTAILVAHCLRPVGDTAMELGCSMASIRDAEIHVLHSLELPEMAGVFPKRVPAETVSRYRATAEQHIRSQLEEHAFASPPNVHVVTDRPDFAVLKHIEQHQIDLVVMGTVARAGIAGLITGNTAERLLPRIPCSVLAVKPSGFTSPVHV